MIVADFRWCSDDHHAMLHEFPNVFRSSVFFRRNAMKQCAASVGNRMESVMPRAKIGKVIQRIMIVERPAAVCQLHVI